MAYLTMNPVHIPKDNSNRQRNKAWELEVKLSTTGNSAWVIIPSQIANVTVSLIFDGGSAQVQHTTSTIQDVYSNTANGINWDNGIVSANVSDVCVPVTAVRLNVTAAPTTFVRMQIRAQ